MTFYSIDEIEVSRTGFDDGRFDDLWTPGKLTDAEHGHLELRRLETERQVADDTDRPPRRLPSRMVKAVDRWSLEAGHVANGLTGATVTIPPSRRSDQGRRGTGPSDPTGGMLDATLAAVDREARAFAHLTGPCRLDRTYDETGMLHVCPRETAVKLAADLDVDVDGRQVVDGLLGTPPTTTAWGDAVQTAQTWHTVVASEIKGRFYELWGTSEPSQLEDIVTRTEQIARHMDGIAGRLAHWSSRVERQCRCGGRKPDDANDCGRCRTAKWRRGRQAAG